MTNNLFHNPYKKDARNSHVQKIHVWNVCFCNIFVWITYDNMFFTCHHMLHVTSCENMWNLSVFSVRQDAYFVLSSGYSITFCNWPRQLCGGWSRDPWFSHSRRSGNHKISISWRCNSLQETAIGQQLNIPY